MAGRPRPRARPPARVPRARGRGRGPTSRSPTPTRPTGCRPSCARWPPRAPGTRSCARPSTRWRATRSAPRGPTSSSTARSSPMRCSSAPRATAPWSSSTPSPSSSARARAGVERVGLRVALPGIGVEPTRFGIAPALVPEAAARARALGLRPRGAERAPRLHRLRAARSPAPRGWAPRSPCSGRPRPTATRRPPSAWRAWPSASASRAIDLGGGFPAAPAVAAHAAAVADALRANGFTGRLILEPGRALVTDAVALAFSVVAIKQLDDGTRCVVVDAGTNLLPGTLWSWPRIEASRRARERPTHAGARQRAAVPERRRPAPGRAVARAGARRRAARARRRRLPAGAIDALRRPAARGARPRRRPLAAVPAA